MVLHAGEVHIWHATFLALSDQLSAAESALSEDERERAARLHFKRDRQRYVLWRGTLRRLLGRYLDCQAGEIGFEYGPQGKPALSGPCSKAGLNFNATHSHELALFAFVRCRRIGIDVEHLCEIPEARGIAKRYFTPQEAALFESNENVAMSFLRLWTRKEAVIKAVGVGLSMPLNCFDLSGTPTDGTGPFSVNDADARGATWTLHDLPVAPNYLAALVVEGDGVRLGQFTVDGLPTS